MRTLRSLSLLKSLTAWTTSIPGESFIEYDFIFLPVATLTCKLSQDLKGDKILVQGSGLCKISDFETSITDDINMMGAYTSMQGSVFWMAPEVVNGQKSYDPKIDIWSIGCVVFEMWTGERPWNGQDFVAVLIRVCIRLDRLSGRHRHH